MEKNSELVGKSLVQLGVMGNVAVVVVVGDGGGIFQSRRLGRDGRNHGMAGRLNHFLVLSLGMNIMGLRIK